MAVSRNQLFNEVVLKLQGDKTVRPRTKRYAERVADDIRKATPSPENPSSLTKTGPYATGASAKSIIVERQRDRFRLPRYRVVSYDEFFHFLEYGTGPDGPDTNSPWGRDTPTPEFAPFGRTALKHGGTVD